jgi:formylglycine-generating enzyme required for sulfatase activity
VTVEPGGLIAGLPAVPHRHVLVDVFDDQSIPRGLVGRQSRYWWGNDFPTPKQANFGRNVNKTTAVGSYPPNPWGLRDMNGNVWEWVEDCWNDSYKGAPSDGSAWTTSGDCGYRVLRGGSWFNEPEYIRSAYRIRYSTRVQDHDLGFRVARTLR